ncbi:MAG: carbohydrate ABC transporter permease, partial [Gammaproteobacteria bacterium]|nr:carbohydrate ABC transporter permease [Gammaproteobacteria bacterium]
MNAGRGACKTWYAMIHYLLPGALALMFTAPLLFMIAGSLKPNAVVLTQAGTWRALLPDPGQISLHNYREVFARVPFGRYLFNSLW